MFRSVFHAVTVGLVRRVPAGVRRWVSGELGWVLAAGVLFVAVFQFPYSVAADDVDASWMQILTYLQSRGAQAGVDYVFPYGPLHTLSTFSYDPAAFWYDFTAEVLFKLAAVGLLVRLARQLPGVGGGLFVAGLVLLSVALPLPGQLYTLAALSAAWVPILKGRLTWIDALLGPTFLAAAGLSNFTLVAVGVLDLGVLTVFLLTRRPRWHAVVPVAVYAAATVALAAVAGQKLSNLPAYYAGGLAYSAGYVDGLALSGPPIDLQLYGLAVALTAGVVVTAGRAGVWRADVIAGLVLVAAVAAFGWRYGFVRHDDGHALHPFELALFLPVLAARVVEGSPRPDARRRLVAAGVLVAALGGFEVGNRNGGFARFMPSSLIGEWWRRAGDLADPSGVRDRIDAHAAAMRVRYDLPAIRAAVGSEPVDVLTESQGVALLNGLTLTPRPTLQSVNAVSAGVLRRNADHFADPSGPRFVLVRWTSFDRRYPTLNDGPALLAVLPRFRLVLEEKGFLLLERRPPEPPPAEPRVVLDRVAKFEEAVDIPPAEGGYQSLTLGLEYSLLGRVRMAVYRPPTMWLNVRDAAGTWRPYRVIPSMASSEFLLDPLCDGNPELKDLFDGKGGWRVTGLMLWIDGPDRPFLEQTFALTVRAYPPLPR